MITVSLLETAIELDQLAVAMLCHLSLLTVVDVSTGEQYHAYVASSALDEFALVDEHVWHHEHFVVAVELVILEVAFVDPAVPHDHGALDALVIEPDAVENAPIAPNHLALALSLSLLELAFVVSLLELDASLQRRQRVLVEHLAVAIGTAVFEYSDEGVAVLERDTALAPEPPILNTATIKSILLLSLLNLEEIVVLVLNLPISISSVLNELPLVNYLVLEVHFPPPNPLVIVPLALVPLSIRIEHDTLAMSPVIRVVAIVERPICEKDLDPAMRRCSILKSALNYLVGARKQYSLSIGHIVSPISFVQCAACKLANASTMPLIILESPFINFSVLHANAPLAIPLVF